MTLKAAWFLSHRIREAMKDTVAEVFGGMGGAVEVDETFIGRDFNKKPRGQKKGRGFGHKYRIVSLVDNHLQSHLFSGYGKANNAFLFAIMGRTREGTPWW